MCVLMVGCEFEPPSVTRIAPSPLVPGSYSGDGQCVFTLGVEDQTATETSETPTQLVVGQTGVPVLGSREILPGDVTTLETSGIEARWTATRVVTNVDGVTVNSTGSIAFDLGEGQIIRVFGPKTETYRPGESGGIDYAFVSTGTSAGLTAGSLEVEIACNWSLTSDTLTSGAAIRADIFRLPGASDRNPIEVMETRDLQIGSLGVRAWLADDAAERQKGLMFVGIDELQPFEDGDERGMLFVFTSDQRSGFWMRGTYINLDIAFIDADGIIVDIFTMTALDETSVRPRSSYRYALELREGVFGRKGIVVGQFVDIPNAVLKRSE